MGKPLDSEIPKSRNVCVVDARDYYVTAGEWNNEYGSSYEIGIRGKATNRFWLIQANWNEYTIKLAAEAVGACLDAGLTVENCQAVFSP